MQKLEKKGVAGGASCNLLKIKGQICSFCCLNNRTLRIARDNGLPSNALLSPGDNLDSKKPIAFVEARNKIAHGEITHLMNDLSDYDPAAEQIAANQREKMRKFVSEWFNTAPDVQKGYICNNRWPK